MQLIYFLHRICCTVCQKQNGKYQNEFTQGIGKQTYENSMQQPISTSMTAQNNQLHKTHSLALFSLLASEEKTDLACIRIWFISPCTSHKPIIIKIKTLLMHCIGWFLQLQVNGIKLYHFKTQKKKNVS